MGKVEIKLQSSAITRNPRQDRTPTVFKRSISKLTEEKLHPGKVLRVYVHLQDDYKVFGVFTLNRGGSVSFFPDFYNLNEFDHLTLNRDFINKKGHLTRIEGSGKHKKAYEVEVAQLPTGDYHLVTFGMNDGDLLMDSLPEVSYPDIEFEDEHQKDFLALLKDALHTDALMLDFPEEPGSFFIQVLVTPKDKDTNEVSVETGFDKFFHLKDPVPAILNTKRLRIQTPDNCDFTLLILCFKLPEILESQFSFCM